MAKNLCFYELLSHFQTIWYVYKTAVIDIITQKDIIFENRYVYQSNHERVVCTNTNRIKKPHILLRIEEVAAKLCRLFRASVI